MSIGSLQLERWTPALLGSVALFASFLLGFSLPNSARNEILAAAISVGSILAGFTGTSKAILMALPPDGVIARVRSSGYIEDLACYMSDALVASLAVCVFSILGYFSLGELAESYYAPVWLMLGVLAVTSFWRVSKIMLLILRMNPTR